MNDLTASVVLLAGTSLFASFCWAARFHFRASVMPLGMKLVSAANLAAFAAFVVRLLLRGQGAYAGVALALMAISGALFGWTLRSTQRDPPGIAFATMEVTQVFRHGPYRLVRHPFYTSYLLFWLATCLAAPGPSGWIALAILSGAYVEAVRREEAGFARSPLSSAYMSYRQTTGAFLPRPASLFRLRQHHADT